MLMALGILLALFGLSTALLGLFALVDRAWLRGGTTLLAGLASLYGAAHLTGLL